ncbi:hypothetical protein [Faecalispora jeddahensis]|uniref:hypothetical protein n=1 Tax=Faecalispora jeddahensis TaxID=1414721 RepID=UPI00145A6C12|nr:hypothetical protein [Faecalispora jeddahensis]
MNRKIRTCLMVIIASIVTSAIMPVYASSDLDYTPVAGGAPQSASKSNSSGAISGIWSEDMQGIRISVVNQGGEPAMTFDGKKNLDLLFSLRNINKVDFFGGGAKTNYVRFPFETSIKSFDSEVMTISSFVGKLNSREYKLRGGESKNNYKKLLSLPKPIQEKSGKWVGNGIAIKNMLYGSGSKIADDAQFYNIFNVYRYNTVTKKNEYIWAFKDDEWTQYANGKLTNEEWTDYSSPDKKGAKTPLQIMQDHNYIIVVEPIIWAQPRQDKKVYSPYMVYGTQTTLGATINWLATKTSFKNAKNAKYGGYDIDLFGGVGRKAFCLQGSAGATQFTFFQGVTTNKSGVLQWFTNPEGFKSSYYPNPNSSSYVTNKDAWSFKVGWAMHLYYPKNLTVPNSTVTWDSAKDPDNKKLVPAPEPPTTAKTEDKHYRIVKVYEDEVQDSETTTTIQHVTTNVREQTIPSIYVQDEAKYKVIEWKYGNPYTQVKESTQWDDPEIANIRAMKSGKQQDYVEIADPADKTKEVTLYVRLRKPLISETGVVEPTNLTINESQLSKAIHTNDSTVDGDNWGKYGFSFSIGSFKDTKKLSYTDSENKSHSKNVTTDNGWTDNSLTLIFKQQGTKDAMQVAEGVNSLSNNKVYSNNGVQTTKLNSFGKTDIDIGRDGTKANGADLVTLIWRNQDKPTLAKYKQTDIISTLGSNNFNVPNGLIGSSNTGLGKRQANGSRNYNLALTFGLDNSSDKSATSVSETWHGKRASTSKTLQLKMGEWAYQFKGVVKVDTYRGTSKAIGNEPFSDGKSTNKTFQTGSHFEATATQGKQNIQFFPYIKMSYMTNELDRAIREEKNKSYYINDSRFDTYILSEQKSSILPSDAVEVGWNNSNEEESLLLDSQQWTMHTRGTDGSAPWKQPNRVLPGGALYELYTPNETQTSVKLVTYQTIVDSKTRGYLSNSLSGNEYTEALAASSHSSFVSNAREVLDNLRVVQWVRKLDWESLNTGNLKAWGDNWASASGALKILGGGQSLGELGMEHKTNTEEKYHIKQGTDKVRTSDGDLDIVNENQVSTIFKVFTDTAGNVYLASYTEADNAKAKDIASLTGKLKDVNADTYTKYSNIKTELLFDKTVSWKDVQGRLSEDAAQINSRTSIITNIVKSLERNTGNDKTAAWAKADGKWYNEAFDGIYVVRQATTMRIGFMQPLMRGAVLDPALCPPNKGKADLFSTAFLSQFCVNDTSDASIASGKGNQYIGTFKGKDIRLPEMQGMYQSKKFYIPNVNVQDLRG